jgi:NitT/TauT family transport system ATP-binding protein
MTVEIHPSDGLVIENVSKTYPAASQPVHALEDVSLELSRGQFLSIIGPSGCGKTTLLRLIAGLEQPDRGQLRIFGETIEAARARKHIGFVPQNLALLPWRTVLENVRLPLELNRAAERRPASDPRALLEDLGLGDALDRRPNELSGGMRQRVAIARALVAQPSVLLMDEPFSSLDELTREALRKEVLEFFSRHETTVVFVTHSVTEAVYLSDEIAVMTKGPGRIAARVVVDLERPRPDLIEASERFRALEIAVRAALRDGSQEDRGRARELGGAIASSLDGSRASEPNATAR